MKQLLNDAKAYAKLFAFEVGSCVYFKFIRPVFLGREEHIFICKDRDRLSVWRDDDELVSLWKCIRCGRVEEDDNDAEDHSSRHRCEDKA